MCTKGKRILFVVNGDRFFKTHRMELAERAIELGYIVAVATTDSGYANIIREIGVEFFEIPFDRYGTNPIRELRLISSIRKTIREFRPDIIHNLTIKPVIYGTLLAKVVPYNRKIRVINAITGLGYAFSSDRSSTLKKLMIMKLYRLLFNGKRVRIIFQNPDDKEFFIKNRLVKDENTNLIVSSGVDLNRFRMLPLSHSLPIKVLFSGRLLVDKGVYDYIDAAAILKKRFPGTVFQIAGEPDQNSLASASEERLTQAENSGTIILLGYQEDMVPVLASSDIVVLPSYYGEGVPKALIEACAAGRPIITTDTPGCRETLVDGVNGFFVNIRDPKDMAEKLERLIIDPDLRHNFATESRKIAETRFDVETVVARTIELYN